MNAIIKHFRKHWQLHAMLIPGVIVVLIFAYFPMYGLVIAFQHYVPARGFFGNQEWIGLGNFEFIFSMPNFITVITNTLSIAIWKIVLRMVFPILVSLLLNEVIRLRFKKAIQTMIYFPYFISWVVFAGILVDILSQESGIVNDFLSFFGMGRHFFLGNKDLFQGTLIFTDTLKNFGFETVIYMAALTSIDPTQYEAAAIDGAGKIKQTIYITLPGLSMIIVLMLVLNLGNVLNAGFDQVFNLYSPAVYSTGDIIDTYVYRLGLVDFQYGPATAVGFFRSAVSMVLISVSYLCAYKFFDYRIF